uniref:Pentatricopeptide repeat-containing protein n=1 Tax=Ananas comosus var. bracteatus TaxID=296719 RepID=A0A6V7PPF8_ANACO|nr:unnamed protein product [Ananas comosus var. bracteatus]
MPLSPAATPSPAHHPVGASELAQHYAAVLHRLSTLPRVLLRPLRSLHAHLLVSGLRPRSHLLNRLLHLYSLSRDLPSAHRLFLSSPPNPFSATSLLSAFAASRRLDLALRIFASTPLRARDPVLYNALISALSRAPDAAAAAAVLRSMLRDGFRPDAYTFTAALSAIAPPPPPPTPPPPTAASSTAPSSSPAPPAPCQSPMPSLPSTCAAGPPSPPASVDEARRVFDAMDGRFDVVWNAMISGYVQSGMVSEAFELFREMLSKQIPLDEFTYTSVLSACANAGLFLHGKAVHAHVVRSGPDFRS